MATPPRRFFQMTEVAEMFSTSVAQIRALIRRGDLRAIQIGGRGQWRIEQSEIDAYVQRAYEAAEAALTTQHGTGAITDPDRDQAASEAPVRDDPETVPEE